MKKTGTFLLTGFLCIAFAITASAQKRARRDTVVIHCPVFSGSYAFDVPGGDLARRFGVCSSASAAFRYKTGKNYLFGLQWSYLFGNNILETGILDSISTADGHVIDKEGKYADLHMFERGYMLNVSAGKIFNNFLSPNVNSGPLVTVGAGILQHRIKIYDNGGRTPQLSGDYLKGYDRLTNGIACTEFLGYWFMSRNHYLNFYGGFEMTQGFTKSRRSWDYDLMRADTQQRTDLLWSVRVGWIIPITRNVTSNVYSY